jgi:2-dehydropantoate 2-reductase
MRIAVYGGSGATSGAGWPRPAPTFTSSTAATTSRPCASTAPRVQTVKGDFAVQVPATDDLADVGPCDYILFCVKAFDTEPARPAPGRWWARARR